MANIESFLSKGFLQEFIETFPHDYFSDDFLPNIELYRFLNYHTDIVLGGEKIDYNELIQTDGLTRNLIDRYLQGDSSVKIENWNATSISENRKIFKFGFLSSLDNVFNSELNEIGFATYQLGIDKNPKKIINYEAILVTDDDSVTNRLESWESLNDKLLPFNSIIIVDNYLFSSLMQTNATFSMIKSLLLNRSSYIYLTFVYQDDDNLGWSKIKDAIENEEFDSNIEISVLKIHKKSTFHDRIIITNSQLIVAGNSFNNFLDKNNNVILKSPTILNLNSHACTFNNNNWSEIAKSLLQTLKNIAYDRNSSSRRNVACLTNPLLSH